MQALGLELVFGEPLAVFVLRQEQSPHHVGVARVVAVVVECRRDVANEALARSERTPEPHPREPNRRAEEPAGERLQVGGELRLAGIGLRAGEDRVRHRERERLQLGQPVELPHAVPARDRARDHLLDRRHVGRQRRAVERRHQHLLAPPVLGAVDEDHGVAAEQLVDVRRRRAGALEVRLVHREAEGLRPGEADEVAAEDARLPHRAELPRPLLEEVVRVAQPVARLAEEGHAQPARRELQRLVRDVSVRAH